MFGPRGTGKSTFLTQFFSGANVLWIDLLSPEIERRYALHPDELTHQVNAMARKPEWIVIDEVQKVPALLDVVHHLIESQKIKFGLTGSSARKLKLGGANLLAGRAFVNYIFPLTAFEMANAFDLNTALRWGTLPKITQFESDEERLEFLQAYAHTYLKEEIMSEQLVRKIDPFRRFLEISSQSNGSILNYSNISRDVGADTKTVQNYYEILQDTMVGFFLEPFHQSIRKQQRQSPKFYWFDLGVKRALDRTLGQSLEESTYGYGNAFEHFLITEIHRLSLYQKRDYRLYYLRTKNQLEIDLILDRPGMPLALIEIKSTRHTTENDSRSIRSLISEFSRAEGYVLSLDPLEKKIDSIWFLPWHKGLEALGLSIKKVKRFPL